MRTREHQSWRVAAAAAVVALAVLAAACGDSSPAPLPPLADRPGSSDQPFALGPGAAESAAFGDSVAVVNPSWGTHLGVTADGPAVAAMSPDGTWRELPEPEPVGPRRLLSTDQGLLLLGKEDGRLRLQHLGPLDAEWHEVDLPRLDFNDETEFWEEHAAGDVAVMGTTMGWLVTDRRGEVELLEFDDDWGGGMVCVIDDDLIELRTRVTPGTEYSDDREALLGSLRRLDRAGQGWSALADPPSGIDVDRVQMACGPDGPIVLTGESELRYDTGTDEWSSRPVTLPPSIDELSSFTADGVLDDGTVFVLDPNGQIRRRSPDGNWTDAAVRGNGLVTTNTAAYAVGPDTITPVP